MKIDSHHHLWQIGRFDYAWLDAPALAPIRRDFLPADLLPHLRATGMQKTVFVQTQHSLDETRWALALTEQHDFLGGVVGWVDLRGPACEAQLLELKAHPRFVGVRHVTQDEPDEDFIVRDDVLRGLAMLEKHHVPFDLLFYVQHLRHAPALAQRLPNLKMVIDHLGKPRIKERLLDDWRRDLQAAAACPNVYCKLSGLVTEADWQSWRPADLRPYVITALELFGPERCMFGSDWPVCLLAASYAQVVEAVDEALGPISDGEREQIFGGTAARFYGLALE
jgi:L-fuconolactonase